MARSLLFSVPSAAAKSSFGALASLVLCSFTLMACASHTWRRWRHRHRHQSSEPVISGHQVQPEDGCLWQRSILMGEKCQLPDFSGIINYDTAGNLVAPRGARPAGLQKRDDHNYLLAVSQP